MMTVNKRKFIATGFLGLTLIFGTQGAFANRGPASEKRSTMDIEDTVKKLRNDDDGTVVLFKLHAGSYYLKKDLAGGDAFRKKLEQSLKDQKPLKIKYESQQMTILDVK